MLLSKSTSYITDPQQTAATPSDCLSMHDFMPSQEDFRRFGQDGLQDLSLLCSMPNKSSTMLNHQASIIINPHPTHIFLQILFSAAFLIFSHPCYQYSMLQRPKEYWLQPRDWNHLKPIGLGSHGFRATNPSLVWQGRRAGQIPIFCQVCHVVGRKASMLNSSRDWLNQCIGWREHLHHGFYMFF